MRRFARRAAMVAGALGAAAAMVGGASFALFTSTAAAQQDQFAAGTVILGAAATGSCTITNMEPGDSSTNWSGTTENGSRQDQRCAYQLTYSGSLEAWIALQVGVSSQAGIGGTGLYDGTATGLQLQIGDGTTAFDNLPIPQPITVTPASNGWTDTIYTDYLLPLAAGNQYQGGSATVTLTANAVQQSNNDGPNLIQDGNFASPAAPSGSFTIYNTGSLGGSPWQVTSGSVDIDAANLIQPAVAGGQSLDMSGNNAGAIAQTVPTTTGQQYVLRFEMAGNSGCPPTVKTMNVQWNGSTIDSPTLNTAGHSYGSMGWVYHQYVVTASGASLTVAFQSTTATSCGPEIGNVSLQAITW